MKNNDEDRGGFFSMFTGIDKLINVVADMVEKDKEEVHINGDIKPDNQRKITGKYGINIKLAPDKLDGFSNIRFDDTTNRKENGPKIVVPVTDVFEEEDKITVVSELPGVKREDIEFYLDRNTITITATKKDICYSKKVELDFIPERDSIKENFNNSIYSLMICKRAEEK